jgi:hypothetical protein
MLLMEMTFLPFHHVPLFKIYRLAQIVSIVLLSKQKLALKLGMIPPLLHREQ